MKIKGRSGARRLAMQALYQAQIGGQDQTALQAQFSEDDNYARCDSAYFEELLEQVLVNLPTLDGDIETYGDIKAAQLDPVEHAVLWLALAELRYQPNVPAPVLINEAIELAKVFGAEGGHRYVNGLLDKARKSLRPSA